jgi:replicative DNA helicase
MKDKEQVKRLIHSPLDLGREHLAWAQDIKDNPGIPFGVQAIDRVVIPIRPGNFVCLLARPGHGKTSILAYLARRHAQDIIGRGMESKEAIVYITLEQMAEELEAMFQANKRYSSTDIAWGRAPMEEIRRNSIKRAKLPIWVIGHGIQRASQRLPRLTPDTMFRAVMEMEREYGVKPVLLLFDYLQMIPSDGMYRDRFQRVAELPFKIKELCGRLAIPGITAVQASREVDRRNPPIPEMEDCQLASSIEQTADKILSFWRPIRTFPNGGELRLDDLPGRKFVISERLFIIRLVKQRGDKGRYTWVMSFEPENLRLAEMEHENEARF